MGRRAGVMALVANTFGADLLDGDLRVREFDVVSAAAERVTFCELRLGDQLGDVARSCSELLRASFLRAEVAPLRGLCAAARGRRTTC
jgi:hypothetical protein